MTSRKVTVSLFTLLSLLIVSAGLIAMNVVLLMKNRNLEEQLAPFAAAAAANFAQEGTQLPHLTGRNTDGKAVDLIPAQSAPHLILVFSPDCKICDRNWPRWDRLLEASVAAKKILFLSTANDVSSEYLARHQMMGQAAVIGLDRKIAAQYRLNVTPQTLFVKEGKIAKVWPGVLSERDVSEIKNLLEDPSRL